MLPSIFVSIQGWGVCVQRKGAAQGSRAVRRAPQWAIAVQHVNNQVQSLGLRRGVSRLCACYCPAQCTAQCTAHLALGFAVRPAALFSPSPLRQHRSVAQCLEAVQSCSTGESDRQRRTSVELVGVNAEQQRRLEKYLELVLEQNKVMNLTGVTRLDHLLTRT